MSTLRETLALHQVKGQGSYITPDRRDGMSLTCTCGEVVRFDYADLPEDESRADPYAYAKFADHQLAEHPEPETATEYLIRSDHEKGDYVVTREVTAWVCTE